jgi:dihydrofolate reductase
MISLIVAFDQQRGIGFDGGIPWFIPGELKWVGETTRKVQDSTKKNALIMGRKTYESLPSHPNSLKERVSLVISSKLKEPIAKDVVVVPSFDAAVEYFQKCSDLESAFVFGGASVYDAAMENDELNELLITHIPGTYNADTFFPLIPKRFVLKDVSHCTYDDVTVERQRYINNVRTEHQKKDIITI